MDDKPFECLLGRLLDEELTADELAELGRLAGADPARRAELQSQLEADGLIAQAEDELRDSPLFVAAVLDRLGRDPFVDGVRSAIEEGGHPPRRPSSRPALRAWAIAAAAAVVAAVAGVALLRPQGDPAIVRIGALNGSVQWTGDGGRVKVDLEVGRPLGGGTMESLSAESWAMLEFRDGSKVTVSGLSMLTIAEGKRKELHLRQGSLSASVSRQPEGEPMVIHTPTAEMEVLGTQLNVDAGPASTVLNVNEGRVRMTRLVDGSIAEVPADHQIVASLDRSTDYKARPRPEPIHDWRSRLPADTKYGRWQPGEGQGRGRGEPSLRSTPLLLTCGRPRPLLVFLAAFSVDSKDSPPVVLGPGSRFRIRGRMETTGLVYFGLTMHHPKGGFAGKYIAGRKVELPGGFELEFRLDDFQPDDYKNQGAGSFPPPIGLQLVDCWCLTLHEDFGLRIEDVELISNKIH